MRQNGNNAGGGDRAGGEGSSSAETPIMRQYFAAKNRYPRHLLFFRVGDFFELFYDDAKTAARALGLTLTARYKDSDPVPMAGVPAHAAEGYLARLLRQGYSVAICDQTEDSSQAKGLVKRDVTRVVTPGTVLEENLLEAKKPNKLLAVAPEGLEGAAPDPDGERRFGLAVVDLASGSFFVQEVCGEAALRGELARLAPSEVLLPEERPLPPGVKAPPMVPGLPASAALSHLKRESFFARAAQERLVARFSENGRDKSITARLKKLFRDQPLAGGAAGALSGYIEETFAGGKVLLSAPQAFDPEKFVTVGDTAIRSLELVETLRTHSFEGSLLWAIDRTCSGPGGRLLREWLLRPLRDIDAIRARQDAVERLAEDYELRDALREQLKALADLERIAARLAADKATPRDLLSLRESLRILPKFEELLSHGSGMLPADGAPPPDIADLKKQGLLGAVQLRLRGHDATAALIAAQLRDDCSNAIDAGGLMREGVDAELDRLRGISSGGKEWIAQFQQQECARTGIQSLKIGYNRVFGYFIEISRANLQNVPADYERRQTLTNAERYTTPELKTREAEVLGAEEKICALEQKLFLQLRETVAAAAGALHATGQALAELDVFCSLGEIAHRKNHVRPVLTGNGRLSFEQMRHPVLEETLPRGELVPNDLGLCAGISNGTRARENETEKERLPQIVILTGPNMAGKSTYIRCTALCTILAQMGAFVPAERAEVGLVDRIFTRVGAADDLAGGRSTFMVEMAEVAEILSACSERSLLILDEVGRGTSTYDGVSLAWSLIEHLHEGPCRPRTLFATHYHELAALEEELPRVRNYSASVKEWQGEITFLHRVVAGPSERSFGIHVARLAGLPKPVLERARAILNELENDAAQRVSNMTAGGAQIGQNSPARTRKRLKPKASDGQMMLFEPSAEQIDPAVKGVLDALRALDPQSMTPLEALTKLDEIAKKARGR
jgi:DNA mismatch repair protein MutS